MLTEIIRFRAMLGRTGQNTFVPAYRYDDTVIPTIRRRA